MASRTTACVVVPAHRAGAALEACLDAVAALAPAPAERIVVADGGDAAVVAAARRRGLKVAATPQIAGPAAARNLGAACTASEVIVFVDSDVVVPREAVDRIVALLDADPGAAAVFGSYDDRAGTDGLVARFKNLLHHWTHQHATRAASTFWTGFGAVRRAVFDTVGGFDERQRWLEDVELGYRLRATGHRIVAAPELQVTHLKRWTLASMLVSDVCHRAWPWTELIHRYHSFPADLDLSWRGRASVALTGLAPLALAAAVFGGGVTPAAVAGAMLLGLVGLNLRFYRLLAASGGFRLAVTGTALHWLSLLGGGAAFAAGSVRWWLVGRAAHRRAATADAPGSLPARRSSR